MDTLRTLFDSLPHIDTVWQTDSLWVLRQPSLWRDALAILGPLAAVAAALATATLAYIFNRRLLRYNIAYASYQRTLERLRELKAALWRVREVTADVGAFVDALDRTGRPATTMTPGRPAVPPGDVDELKFVQDAKREWSVQLEKLREAQTRLFAAKDAVAEEYHGHSPVSPRLHGAVTAFCGRLQFGDGQHVSTLLTYLLTAVLKREQFPLAESCNQLRDAKEMVLVALNDFDRWYLELIELMRQQAFSGVGRVKKKQVKRMSGNPEILHLTLDGFKTARELGWYDPKLDSRRQKPTQKA